LTIPETPRYTFDIARDVEKADQDVKAYIEGKREGLTEDVTRAATQKAARETLEAPKASWSDFGRHYRKRKNFLLLLGTAGSWFCLDVAFYGLSLNNGTILEAIGYSTKNANNVYQFMHNTAVGNIIIVLAGAVPGYWVSVATIDTIGRKTIQLMGFCILTILFIVMGFAYWHIGSNGLLAIYVLAQFFFNFGKYFTLYTA
jgi:MFS transporter, PHS family, inorganic phosphate transporter